MIRLRRWFRYPLLVVALLLVLAAVEKVGRNFPRLMPPQWQLLHSAIVAAESATPIPDPEIGFLPRPGPDKDSKGFPNSDPWPDQAAIVFLGDSLVVGPGVQLPGKFTSLIGDQLPGQPVVNLAVNAAGIERQTLIFRRFGAALRPRIVVACVYLVTDFANDLRFRSWVQEGQGQDFYTYRIPGDRGAYVSPLERVRTLQWGPLLEQSWLFVKGRELAIRWTKGDDALVERYRRPDGAESLMYLGNIAFANTPAAPDDPRIEALLMSLAKLQALVTESDARLLVALIPSIEELVRADPDAEQRNVVARTRDRLTRAGYSLLDLYPPLRAAGRTQTPYFVNGGHLNAYGHQIVAHEFVAWFQQHRGSPDGEPCRERTQASCPETETGTGR